MYSLKQAAKSWYDELTRLTISKANFVQSSADPCLYIKKGNEWCFLIVYVDDMIIATKTNEIIDKVKADINSIFKIQDLGDVKFYLGIEVIRDEDEYIICVNPITYR